MEFQIENSHRFQYEDTPIYVRAAEPDWFVPNPAGDRVLQQLQENIPLDGDLGAYQFLKRLPDRPLADYPGRASYLRLQQLSELWFHLTNRCNLTCAHCLFASSPETQAELTSDQIREITDEAHGLGCRVFALTGGDPFVHSEIKPIVSDLLQYESSHSYDKTVSLSNGSGAPLLFLDLYSL